ncbi:MAG: tyrosine-type recombinase/integrase [Paracoccaceae bacterium]|nr:tyrosine-type recombinase/integrase [Paracoccaceae bacterium]
MRSYRADVEAFVAWCDARDLVPFPTEVATLCNFLEDQGRTRAPSTVRRRLYAIRKVHRLLRLPDPTRDEDINLSLRRVRRGKAIRPKQAKGLTRNYLDLFLATQPDTVLGLRNRAMLSLGYELLSRRSELVALRTDDLEERADGTFQVLIRRSKADPFGAGRIAFTSPQTAELVRAWLERRGPDIDWLFCPVYQDRPVDRDLSTTTVKRLVKHAAECAGLDLDDISAFSGHSMRVGAAQDLLRRGFDTAAIMRAGGWKSVNVLMRYLEQAEHNVWASAPGPG